MVMNFVSYELCKLFLCLMCFQCSLRTQTTSCNLQHFYLVSQRGSTVYYRKIKQALVSIGYALHDHRSYNNVHFD